MSTRLALGKTEWSWDPRPRFADVNGDKSLDIVLGYSRTWTSTTQRQLRVFLNNGKGQFKELPNAGPMKLGDFLTFAFLDADADGDLNNGKGALSPAPGTPLPGA